jgi:hypothetical protein
MGTQKSRIPGLRGRLSIAKLRSSEPKGIASWQTNYATAEPVMPN